MMENPVALACKMFPAYAAQLEAAQRQTDHFIFRRLMSMTTTHYTRSNGEKVEIATMPNPYLASAWAKLKRTEDENHAIAEQQGFTHETPADVQAEIDALEAEIIKRRTVE